MKGTILEKIVESKRKRVDAAKAAVDRIELRDAAVAARAGIAPHRLRDALSDSSRLNIIAEFKRASPSKGIINDDLEPAEIATQYKAGGAAAVSVLTEEDHFMGSLDDLRTVRAAVDLPILRKDFIFDPFQIYEAAAAGADAVLLIAAMLSNTQLHDLEAIAEDDLSLDAVIEVHTLEEMNRVKDTGAKLIGVNNRNLDTFEVSLETSREIIQNAPHGSIMIAESGLETKNDLIELRDLGYSGFLIGETLMRSGDPRAELRMLSGI